MPVVSIINYKGGVGKTTITANIAAEMASRGKKVLMIDLDPQTNLTFSFISVDLWKNKYQDEKTIKSWFDAFIDRKELTELSDLVITPERINKITKAPLDLICSHLGLINVDLELAVMLGGATPRQQKNNFLRVYSLLLRGLEDLNKQYDIVLIDCPPNFNIVTKNALVASDYYIVPAKPDYLSTLGIEQLNRQVKELIQDYNDFASQDNDDEYDCILPQLLGVIFTMVGIRGEQVFSAQQQYIAEMERKKIPFFDTVIRENKTVYADAPAYGVPVVMKNMSGQTYQTVKDELEQLTKEFMEEVGCNDD